MPRAARIDLRDALYHVVARGVGRCRIFVDDRDRLGFLERLETLIPAQDIALFAYVLMTNHFHLVLRRGAKPLARFMARLLTGHAVVFNLRHNRSGHLFQNRYGAVLCDADSYFLELIRYVHLNPVRAGIVEHPEHYRWSSHLDYLQKRSPDWLDTATGLQLLGGRRSYEHFVLDGVGGARRPELSGYANRARDGERRLWHRGQILGGEEFAQQTLERASDSRLTPPKDEGSSEFRSLAEIADVVCRRFGLSLASLRHRSRRPHVIRARDEIVRQAIEVEGFRPVDVSRFLSLSRGAVTHSLRRIAGPASTSDDLRTAPP